MFNIRKDFTDMVAKAFNAPHVEDSSKYPPSPALNEAVFDEALNAVMLWDGEAWVAQHTRPGPVG